MPYRLLLALPVLAALATLISPYLQMRAGQDAVVVTGTARRYLFLSGWVLAVAATWASGLSFAWHAVNFVAVSAALIAFGALALFSFHIRPKFVAVPVGIISCCTSLLMLLYAGATTIFSGNTPATVALGDSQYCRETVYGFVTSDSGEELEIFQRYLFIDRSIFLQIHSDAYPNEPPHASADLAEVLTRCQLQINKERAIAGQ